MNVAIVGCGAIAQLHAECVDQYLGCKLVAVADIIQEKAEALAGKYGVKAYTSYEEMLEKESVDILHICTPHYLHVPIALYALEHGVHVFAEKPPIISKEQWKQLEQVQTNQHLGFCFQNRYNPSIQRVKQLLDSGEAGQIYGARAIVTWSRDELYYTQSGWRGKWDTEGGGVLINQSIHTLDLLTYFLGKPISVDATMANHHLKGVIEVEDTMEAYVLFENDRKACFYATTAYVSNVAPIIEIACEKMVIRIEDSEVTINDVVEQHVQNRKRQGEPSIRKSYWGTGHADCIQDFYKSIEENRPFALDLPHIQRTAQLMLSMYESCRTKETVQLSTFMA